MVLPRSDSHADAARDRILVVASPVHALELLRWATLRSDDVVFASAGIDASAQAFASRYAVDWRRGAPTEADFVGTAAVLLSLDDREAENRVIRLARRCGIAIHVRGRPLVSDFTVLSMMERPWPVQRAA